MNYTEMSADALRDFATTEDLIEAVVALREERYALAAHVERLRLVAENMDYFNDSIDLGDAEIAASDAGDTLDEILARRDALAKAEALDDFSEKLGGTDQELAEIEASRYRRQAEEADQ